MNRDRIRLIGMLTTCTSNIVNILRDTQSVTSLELLRAGLGTVHQGSDEQQYTLPDDGFDQRIVQLCRLLHEAQRASEELIVYAATTHVDAWHTPRP